MALHCCQAILQLAYPSIITPALYIRIYPGSSAILNWLLPILHKWPLYLISTYVHEGAQVSNAVGIKSALRRKGLFWDTQWPITNCVILCNSMDAQFSYGFYPIDGSLVAGRILPRSPFPHRVSIWLSNIYTAIISQIYAFCAHW